MRRLLRDDVQLSYPTVQRRLQSSDERMLDRRRLLDHPLQRQIGQLRFGKAAADVFMHTGEPNLLDTTRRLGFGRFLRVVPKLRHEDLAVFIDRERLACVRDPCIERGIEEVMTPKDEGAARSDLDAQAVDARDRAARAAYPGGSGGGGRQAVFGDHGHHGR